MTAAIIDKLTTVEAAAHTDAAATQHHAALSNMLASLEAHTTLATETPPPALLQKIDAVSEAVATLASTLSNVHHGVQEISSESVKQRDIPDVITERMSRQMQQLLEAAVDGEGDRETALNTTVQLIHEELRSIRTLGNSVEATTGELADLRAVVSDLSQASQQTVTQTEVRELVDTVSQGEAATTEHLQRLEALISSLQEALAERDVDEAIAQLTAKVSDMQAAAVPDTKLTHIQEVLESVHLSVSRDDLDMTLSTRDGLKPSEPRRSIDNKEHALSQGSLPSIAKDNDYSSPAPVPRLADSFTLRTGLRNESIISPRGTPELRTPVHQSQHEKVPALQLPKAVNTDLIAKFQEIRASQVLEFIDQIKYNGEVELLQAYYVKLFVFYRAVLTKVGESETTSAVIVNTLSSLENTLAEASTDAVLQAVAGVRDEVAKLHTSADAVCDSVREVHTSKGDEQIACENGHMADSEPAEGALVRLLSAVQELQQTVCTKDVAVSQFNTLQETMQSVISQEAVMQAVAGVRAAGSCGCA
eukprot:TRINITY_DN774_c0_g1_i8.p1 TRINITY_DN774_c0_g1~~TRINITY_DN774_c0_g1_i8.p1  ORF type:complete len:534 (+),score=225.14 TRINITY_DN774_c0_g1_i8:1879-3480(+)